MVKKGNRENCIANAHGVTEYVRKVAQKHWSFLGPGSEKKWYGTHIYKPNGEWDELAEIMMLNFNESGHPIFRATSALERGEFKSKGKGKSTCHFNGSDDTIEVTLRTVISVDQLGIYGEAADMCGEFAWEVSRNSKGTRKPGATENLETKVDNKSNQCWSLDDC